VTAPTADQREITGQPTWLAVEPDPVLAFLYRSENGEAPAARTAVLFCPAFGWEEMCSYRGRRVWAQTLARSGFAAATFDLPGGGDSGGTPRAHGQLDAWTNAVWQGAGWVAEATGAERVCALGIGFGGLLACRAVAAGAPIDDLILWGVPARGRTWLRELRAYAEMVSSRLPEDRRPDVDRGGATEYIGFLLTEDTAAALEALRLTECSIPDASERRVLLLGRDGIAPDARLREHFEQAGCAVTVQDTGDYGELTTHPQQARAPAATIAKTIAWLSEPAPGRGDGDSRTGRPLARRGPAGDLARPAVELRWNGSVIRETPLRLEGSGGELFAVLSEGVEVDPQPVCAVWLNSGALRHTGPNRAWVEVARRWAARGVPTVRVDLRGIGDAHGPEGCVSDPDLYEPERTRDTLAVLDQLATRGLPDRYVLGGLCSGAYWALHAALADARVRGILMINLYAFFWSADLVAERDTQLSLSALQGRAWRRLMRGQLSREQIRRGISSLRPSRLRSGAGHPVERSQSAAIERALDQLRDQHSEALLLLSRGEGLTDQLLRQGVLDHLERWPNLRCEEIPSRDHLFRALWVQRDVHAALDRALERVLAPV
jgi:alpha-beta hydrolase superfamily lysophospholipase